MSDERIIKSLYHSFKCQQCKYENMSLFLPQLERLAEEHMMQTGHTVVECTDDI